MCLFVSLGASIRYYVMWRAKVLYFELIIRVTRENNNLYHVCKDYMQKYVSIGWSADASKTHENSLYKKMWQMTVIVQNSPRKYYSSIRLMREMDNFDSSDVEEMVCNFKIMPSLWVFSVRNRRKCHLQLWGMKIKCCMYLSRHRSFELLDLSQK